mmetsp:Transcript_13599/g.20702  ORF Transcript_13599/g.20702 Transcript_13599/m.20702 type:complete len:151 (+) Transcript_13599:306-758(+)
MYAGNVCHETDHPAVGSTLRVYEGTTATIDSASSSIIVTTEHRQHIHGTNLHIYFGIYDYLGIHFVFNDGRELGSCISGSCGTTVLSPDPTGTHTGGSLWGLSGLFHAKVGHVDKFAVAFHYLSGGISHDFQSNGIFQHCYGNTEQGRIM